MLGGLGWRCAGRNLLFTNFCKIRNMSKYRRMYVPGVTYFFTVNLASRGKDLLLREIELLRSAYA